MTRLHATPGSLANTVPLISGLQSSLRMGFWALFLWLEATSEIEMGLGSGSLEDDAGLLGRVAAACEAHRVAKSQH